jgi:hypothetical protein
LIVSDPAANRVLARLLTDRSRVAVGDLRPDFDHTPPTLIADRIEVGPPGTGDDRRPLDSWLVVASPVEPERRNPDHWRSRMGPWNTQRLVVLLVGLDPDRTGWRGWVFSGGDVHPLAGFRIVSAGMPGAGADAPVADERWSRTVHAVGERAFWKVVNSSVAVVGASRLGSAVAFQLASVGVRRLTLVDPDTVELHNVVGMTGVTADDAGEKKAVALARRLVAFRPDLAVTAVPHDFLHRQTRLHGADLIVTAVDRDAARLKAAGWAHDHAVPHLDLGTGVTADGIGRLLAGDVRLLLPGAGCVRCVGGLGDLDQAEYELYAPPDAAPRRRPEPWDARGRLGSLPTLNVLAAGTGVQLWLDLLNGDLTGSMWHRLRWLPGRGLETAAALVTAAPDCPVCRPERQQAA